MRLIFTLWLLLFSSVCNSQLYEMIRAAEFNSKGISEKGNTLYMCRIRGVLPTITDMPATQPVIARIDSVKFFYKAPGLNILPAKRDTSEKPVTIRLRCRSNLTEDNSPLIVVDGVPLVEKKLFSEINPNEIESIDILKDIAASAIYGCRAAKGVILVTTKSARAKKFIIKDFLSSDRIVGATVSFISADKKDTLMMAANDSGVIVTDKLKSAVSYQMSVSAIGYKSLSQSWKTEYKVNEHKIMLERDIKTCDEVVVRNGPVFICKRYYTCTKVSSCYMGEIKSDTLYRFSEVPLKTPLISHHIFPNPAQRGKAITIETIAQSDGPIEVRITSLDGKLMLSQLQKTIKGLNRFILNTDSCWSSGIYLVNLYANGKLLASDKIVIQ